MVNFNLDALLLNDENEYVFKNNQPAAYNFQYNCICSIDSKKNVDNNYIKISKNMYLIKYLESLLEYYKNDISKIYNSMTVYNILIERLSFLTKEKENYQKILVYFKYNLKKDIKNDNLSKCRSLIELAITALTSIKNATLDNYNNILLGLKDINKICNFINLDVNYRIIENFNHLFLLTNKTINLINNNITVDGIEYKNRITNNSENLILNELFDNIWNKLEH